MKRSLSGIQPSGILHIGNYFGAIKQFVDNQHDNEGFYFIVDYHALTSLQNAEQLRKNAYDAVLDFLALGLDPEKSTIYLQSDVPECTELAWILSNVSPMGLLERAHSYKDKIAKGISPNVGLFTYPILMAADILLYDADIVPVGKDQKQHLEMTRNIAIKFNQTFGEVFKLPEPQIIESLAVVPGTDGQKMSKSYGNTIQMFASKKELKKQVMGIVTDSTPLEEPKNPDNNITKLYELFATKEEVEEMKNKFLTGGYGYGHAKNELLAKILEYFGEARAKREELIKNPEYVQKVLKQGAEKARDIASKKMIEIKKSVGLSGNIY
ncbi:tryptophanyl-tRNA synthetase [Hypnocyclicus thermotrophus]|uniref:Tryptophan--tRNA ligase n=1 Tax=Hypnocyclicus thermotrophus TaxID=1627895 RepID=A0AA46DYN9_9FUSO|nr:tryptophan--tRNA ligase [Hypnocyclicus thermotrophus]TDT70562.1 tryptophanyl-tRNA synthetase [Hypnocyclicus thermotrophus]